MPTSLTPAQVPDLLRPGMTVFLMASAQEPSDIIAALQARPEASRGVRYVGVQVPGINRVDPTRWHAETRMTAFFITPDMSKSYAAGRIDLMPLQYSDTYAFLGQR